MKWLLARIGLPKAIGLFLEEDSITLSRVVATPFGPIEINSQSEPYDENTLDQVVEQMLNAVWGKSKRRRTPISVGIPTRRVYFSTRPIHATTGDSAPHILLREALRSPNVAINDMSVDVIKASPDARDVASIAACEKNYLNIILDTLERLGVRPFRTEPAPCALLRLAGKKHKAHRGDKVVIRLFLSDTQVLAVLVVDNTPLLWRITQLSQGSEAASLVTAARSLLATSKDCGVESEADTIMVHGREELKRLLDIDWMEEQLDIAINWYDDAGFDKQHIAMGLAQGGLDKKDEGFDLGRYLKPRPTLWQVFPWRDGIVQFGLLAAMALLLGYTYWSLRESKQNIETIAAVSPTDMWAKKVTLMKEKKELEEQVGAVREFVSSRVMWTTCLRDLANSVPDEMYLTSIRGIAEMKDLRKRGRPRKAKKLLVLRGAVVIPEGRLIPVDIDRFLEKLRSNPTLVKDFPLVTLDELNQREARGTEPPLTIFSIECLPGSKKSPAKKK